MDEPTATTIAFSEPDPLLPGGPWTLQVTVGGSGFVARSLPLQATIGTLTVSMIAYGTETSFAGVLAETPNDGDELAIGFGVLTPTGLLFHTGDVV